MPTGYTTDIYEGKETDFKSFALKCARAFGANVTMRDDPMNAEIKEYEVSSYHIENLKQSQKELEELKSWSPEDIITFNEEQYEKKMIEYSEHDLKNRVLKKRYEKILKETVEWNPPTDDHVEYKNFMIDQLQQSIKFDCDYTPEIPTRRDFYSDRIRSVIWYIAYHEDEHKKEVERVKSRNNWNQQLKESLK